MIALLGLLACTLDVVPRPSPSPQPPLTVQDLWAQSVPSGARITLDEVVVTSPLSQAGTTFYVQAPGGGPASGLQVQVGDGMPEWPPPVGTPIRLTGPWVAFTGGPTLWLQDRDDLRVLGEPVAPTVDPWSDDPLLIWALVQAAQVRVTSAVDPAGMADTSLGQVLRPDFGVDSPGWGRVGDLTGINALGRSILLRTPADWTGEWHGDPPLAVGISDLPELDDGTPVSIADLAQGTPWSRTGRYAVLQDLAGDGVWIDTEGFGTPTTVHRDVADWVGELRTDGGFPRLRIWEDPVATGATRYTVRWQGEPTLAPHASVVETEVVNLQGIGARGDRACDDWLLDNRFQYLGPLTDPDFVVGAVLVDDGDLVRLAVLSAP